MFPKVFLYFSQAVGVLKNTEANAFGTIKKQNFEQICLLDNIVRDQRQ